jgi:hypothetical protein
VQRHQERLPALLAAPFQDEQLAVQPAGVVRRGETVLEAQPLLPRPQLRDWQGRGPAVFLETDGDRGLGGVGVELKVGEEPLEKRAVISLAGRVFGAARHVRLVERAHDQGTTQPPVRQFGEQLLPQRAVVVVQQEVGRRLTFRGGTADDLAQRDRDVFQDDLAQRDRDVFQYPAPTKGRQHDEGGHCPLARRFVRSCLRLGRAPVHGPDTPPP